MIEYYPTLKIIHIAAVVISGALFSVRGALLLLGYQQAMAPPMRYTSYAIDTVLLAAAVLLVILLPAAAFANGWLRVKLVLLVAYVVLGSFALKRGRTPRVKRACYFFALLAFAAMLTTALTQDPAGVFFWRGV